MEKKKSKDRHLDVPAEANRDKHINFVALEDGDTDEADNKKKGELSEEKIKEREEAKKNDKHSKKDAGHNHRDNFF